MLFLGTIKLHYMFLYLLFNAVFIIFFVAWTSVANNLLDENIRDEDVVCAETCDALECMHYRSWMKPSIMKICMCEGLRSIRECSS